MNRRRFLGTTAAGVLATGTGLVWAQTTGRALPILPLTDLTKGIEGRIPLALNPSKYDFGNGALSDTFGINSSYLGPLLRVKQGQTLPFDITNGIGDTSTLHWHGLHIPGDVDGGPHQEIAPGATWSPDVPIVQQASMNWFHSPMHGKTARQTYNGLAGVMLIEDDASLSADLPQTYGVDDFTLVLQDKIFDAARSFARAAIRTCRSVADPPDPTFMLGIAFLSWNDETRTLLTAPSLIYFRSRHASCFFSERRAA